MGIFKLKCSRLILVFLESATKQINLTYCRRASMGDNSVLGDERWGGVYGIDIELVAEENCKICFIPAKDIQVNKQCAPSFALALL
jgi:hypothetical protein